MEEFQMNTQRIATLFSCILLASCVNLYPPTAKKEIDATKSYWISYDASRRGTLVVPSASTIKSCSEPAPDIALTLANKLEGGLTTPGGTEITDGEATINATVNALAGRNDVVLLAREALFRICEASLNGEIKKEGVGPLIEYVFDKVAAIATAQAENSKEKADEAKAKALTMGVDPKLLQ